MGLALRILSPFYLYLVALGVLLLIGVIDEHCVSLTLGASFLYDLNSEVFFSLADVRRNLELWCREYNNHCPHSYLADRTPAEVAAIFSDGIRGDQTVLKSTSRVLHFYQIAAGSELNYAPASSDLLGTITRTL